MMHLNQSIVAFAAIILCIFESSVVCAITPKAVIVNKCCDLNEHLNEHHECAVGTTNHWWPLIHMIKIQKLFEPLGDAPRFFIVRERSRPLCESPDTLIGSNKMALFSNGSLYLSEQNQFLHSPNFCIDKDVAILCFPPTQKTNTNAIDSLIVPKKIAKVRKCCGGKAIYFKSSNTCEIVQQSHEVLQRRLLANASFIDFVYGFPDCKISAHFTIAAAFKQSNLELSTGSLTLNSGRQFEWNEYCLEHTIRDGSRPYVSVFTCAEAFAVADISPDTNHLVNICANFSLSSRLTKQILIHCHFLFHFFFVHFFCRATITSQDIRFLLFPIGLLISVIFLIATLATGLLLPSNHHVLHWRCQTFYVSCLLIGDLLLAITQIFGTNITGVGCISIGEF